VRVTTRSESGARRLGPAPGISMLLEKLSARPVTRPRGELGREPVLVG
jgi:hypothetical protein